MEDKLTDIVNNIDGVVTCLKTQVQDIVGGRLSEEQKAAKLADLVEEQGATLLGLKMDLEERAGRMLRSPVLLAELDVDPCHACIVVLEMGEKGIAAPCLECDERGVREAFLKTQMDGSGSY